MYLRGISYAFAAPLMFGLGAILAKLLSGAFDPSIVAFVTLTASGLVLAALLALGRKPLFSALRPLTRREWLDLFLLACPGTSLPLLLTVAGLARTSALEGGLLLQLNGVAALLFAVLMLGERIRWKQGIGVLLLLLGGVLIVIAGAGSASGDISGNLLILIGTVGIGFSYIPAKRLADRADPLLLTAARLLLGGATMAPVAAFQLLASWHTLLWQPTQATLAILLLYVLTNFCIAFFAQQAGLRLLKAWQMAAIGQTVPLFSTFFAILLLHESLTLAQGAGGLLAIFGGIIVSLNIATPAAPAATPAPEAAGTKPVPCAD